MMNCLLEVVLMEINKLENNNTGHPDAKNGLHLTGPSSSSALPPFNGLFSVERLLGDHHRSSPLVASSPQVEANGPLSSESPFSSMAKPLLMLSSLPRDQIIPSWDPLNLRYLANRRDSISSSDQAPLLPTADSYEEGKPAVRCASPRSRTTSATTTYSNSRASSVLSGKTRTLSFHDVEVNGNALNNSSSAQQLNGVTEPLNPPVTDIAVVNGGAQGKRQTPPAEQPHSSKSEKSKKSTPVEKGLKRPQKSEPTPAKRAKQEEVVLPTVQPAGQDGPSTTPPTDSSHDQACQCFTWCSKRFKGGSQLKTYEGVFEPLNLLVAVKVQEKRKQKPILPLLWEAELLRQIDHPAFIEFFMLGALRSFNIEIVELYPHHTLEQELHRESHGLHEARSLNYISQIIDGINYLHDIGVVHRNLNLDAILIGEDDNLKIGQLTLSVYIAPPRKLKEVEMRAPQFLAPEVLRQQHYLRQADFWSIGIILFKMIFNELPFIGTTPAEILDSVEHGLGDLSATSHNVQTLLHMLLTDEDDRADLGTMVVNEVEVCRSLFGEHAGNFKKGNRTSGRSDKVPLDHKVVVKVAEIFEVSVKRVEQSIERRTYNEIHAAYLIIKNNERNGNEQTGVAA